MDTVCKPCYPVCSENDCNTRLYKNKIKLKLCSKHSRYCIEQGCNIFPSFNYKNEKKKLYCAKHKLENMIDITHKRCLNCELFSCFNYENESHPLYCAKHKLENMIDIVNKKCKYEKCNIQPGFNYENKPNALYCAHHKLENMINVKDKKCIYEKCEIYPSFNYKNEKKPLYCSEHKLENMHDVKHKKCIEQGCIIRPNYNYENKKKPLYCSEHKLENMIIITNKKCLVCGKISNYNYKNEKNPLYCVKHKLENMIDITHKRCLDNLCDIIVTYKKYEGYCAFCFINTFPDKPIAKNYKKKEKAVVDFIKLNFNTLKWVYDKIILYGYSKRRPDLLLDLGFQIIIIEIDENQHQDYIDENKRTIEISRDLQYRPIIFIRFNPDKYVLDNKNITSCWSANEDGIISIKKSKQIEWVERLNKLKETVTYWLTNTSDKNIEIVHLYFSLKELKN